MTKTHIYFNDVWTISTHTLTWSVTPRVSGHIRYTEFQLTRSRGAWPRASMPAGAVNIFQLTRSRGAWREDFDFTLNKLNFNSHAHVERDRVINSSNSIYLISTHTLTWSVTCNSRICITYHAFQLTRSRGAWRLRLGTRWECPHFNSHAHVERDMNEFYASGLTNISTHTLTWSVTFSLLAVIFPNVYFNSHAHVERDSGLTNIFLR